MTIKYRCVVGLSIFLTMAINSALANLMITPQRIVFEERQRSASVNLINTSNQTNTYRLHWVQKKQGANGRFIDIPQKSNEVPSASPMLRFSPRQITLSPGEKQTIRIALRRKSGLKNAELRSYLLFQALPSEDEVTFGKRKGSRIKINLLLGFAIPVIVRQGKLNATASISEIKLRKSINKNEYVYGVNLTLKRGGVHTVIGSVKILWKKRKSEKYKQVGILNNVSIYPEAPTIQHFVGLNDFKPSSGYLKISYEGQKEFEGKLLDVREMAITNSDFTIERKDDL